MKLEKIKNTSDPRVARLPELYEEAFPKMERADTQLFLNEIDANPNLNLYAIFDDNEEFAGMVIIADFEECRYLLYLAVLGDKRNGGYGAFALGELQRESDLPILLQAETPTDDLKRRRIEFYKRNGFYIAAENPAILNVFNTNKDLSFVLMSSKPLADCNEYQQYILSFLLKRGAEYISSYFE